ncbi:hypothetical protein KFE25_008654 [Diacronema lutheri]|uniref:Uncharacterized protein n=2 Tax=Diacronema lutheri TaxID=2081491 RepID=A0A8J5XR93_DIALT|nr:hypothetical protein KFE25_008654 [Diacronema lutheri]
MISLASGPPTSAIVLERAPAAAVPAAAVAPPFIAASDRAANGGARAGILLESKASLARSRNGRASDEACSAAAASDARRLADSPTGTPPASAPADFEALCAATVGITQSLEATSVGYSRDGRSFARARRKERARNQKRAVRWADLEPSTGSAGASPSNWKRSRSHDARDGRSGWDEAGALASADDEEETHRKQFAQLAEKERTETQSFVAKVLNASLTGSPAGSEDEDSPSLSECTSGVGGIHPPAASEP